MTTGQKIQADLTWTGRAFEPGVVIEIGDDGRITSVQGVEAIASDLVGSIQELSHRALLPGFVNAHSHSFQRGLRGRGEIFPAGVGNFWSWRDEMYRLVERLDARGLRHLCLQAFGEMRAAGVTTVGEFHYLHHDDPRARDGAFDRVVLDAAAEVGIRVVLLQAFYRTGGVRQELGGGQHRFSTPSLEEYWQGVERLREGLDPSLQSIGAVAHSLRAASPQEVADLRREASAREMVLHLHLEEQRAEVEQVVGAYGRRPMEVLLEAVDESAEGVTAVHCTHTEPSDLERFVEAGGRVCLCPLTEGNLGDGLPPLGRLAAEARDPLLSSLCLGTDSNARISMLEEMRWLEYGQRLAGERRGVLRDGRGEVAVSLIRAATLGGARSLGLAAGTLEPGAWADFTTIDLESSALAEATAEILAEALVFGAGNEAIAATCVGGVWQR